MLVKTSSINEACSYISLAIISSLSMACSSISPAGKNFEHEGRSFPESEFHQGSFGEPEHMTNSTRGSTTIESGAGLLGKTILPSSSVCRALYALKYSSSNSVNVS